MLAIRSWLTTANFTFSLHLQHVTLNFWLRHLPNYHPPLSQSHTQKILRRISMPFAVINICICRVYVPTSYCETLQMNANLIAKEFKQQAKNYFMNE